MYYYARFLQDPVSKAYVVSFRDIPEALTQGGTYEEAKKSAKNALITAIEFYFEDMQEIPKPSAPQEGEIEIKMPLNIWAKVNLLNTLIETGTTQAELARKMGKTRQYIHRLIDLHHNTKIDTIDSALEALGKRGVVNWS